MTAEVAVASRTTPGLTYRVLIGVDGSAACNCPASEFGMDCWHVGYVKEHHMTSQALEVIKVQPPAALLPTQSELGIISTLAKTVVMARGHAVPTSIDSPAKAAAVMLAGWELGVRPLTALRHMAIVNGRTEPDGQLMVAIVLAKEPDARIEIVELTHERCTMRLRRPSRGMNVEYTATIEDAKRAGLIKPNNPWSLYPKDMLRLHASKRLCRAFAPDLVNAVSGIEVASAEHLLAEHDGTEPPVIDLDELPAGALVDEGDDAPASELARLADPETGEVLEGEATEVDDEPTEVLGVVQEDGPLSLDVWTYVGELLTDIATRRFEGDWEKVYAALGGHPEAAPFFSRTASGRPFIDPRGRTNDEAQLLAELLNAWVRVQQSATAPRRAAAPAPAKAEAVPKAEAAPRPPKAREAKDERLGGFSNIGEFYGYCHRELNLTGPQVREIAGVGDSAAPDAILAFEGGLDLLKVACAAASAGVEVS